MIDPKKQFQASLSPESTFRNLIISKDVQAALTASYTILALETVSPEQLQGAKRFMEILSGIGEPPTAPKTFPDKRLTFPEPKPPQPQTKT